MTDSVAPVIEVDTSTYLEEVAKASEDKLVVVYFWAAWCAPCKAMSPMYEMASLSVGPTYKFCKVNIDKNEKLIEMLGIRNVPTTIVVEKGVERGRLTGAATRNRLYELIGKR